MLAFTKTLVHKAERAAANGQHREAIFDALRELSLDDFGRLMFSLPNPEFPSLSKVLPAMADKVVQQRFTGAVGDETLKRALAFVRQMENLYVRHAGRYLRGETVLDFGVGYGRLVRLLYYYTDPQNIWGLDPQKDALDLCKKAGLDGNFRQSDAVPVSLPVDGRQFDLAYAFSVFTHLSPGSAESCLSAVHRVMKAGGLFLATIWPPEVWPMFDARDKTNNAAARVRQYNETGFAYVPHGGDWGKTYGNATVSLDFFRNKGWDVLGYDSTITDQYQLTAILRKQSS